MKNDLLYQLALTQVPHIGPTQAKILLEYYDTGEIFRAKKAELEKIEGIGPLRAASITRFSDFSKAEQEMRFLEESGTSTLFITDPDYPNRLLHQYDPPILLFFQGAADLNQGPVIAVMGDTQSTPYGKEVVDHLVKALAGRHILLVSGLAWGIEALSQQAALHYQVSSVGVLPQGLDTIYPVARDRLAREITIRGGLLSECWSGTPTGKNEFPRRNRIIAGISDALVVIESGLRGDAMITAELASGYHKEVFAVPGRMTDPVSAGCHHLIGTHQAILLSDMQQLIREMGWDIPSPVSTPVA